MSDKSPREFMPVEGGQFSDMEAMAKEAQAELKDMDTDGLFNASEGPAKLDLDPAVRDFMKETQGEPEGQSAEQIATELVDGPAKEPERAPVEEPTELDTLKEENAHLKQKLGVQGSERGDILRRMEEAESRLQTFEQGQQAAQAPVTGRDVARQLDPSMTDADFEDPGMASLYDRMGTMQQAAATEIFGQVQAAFNKLNERFDAAERRSAEASAESKVGGIAPDVKQELEQEWPELKEISDPVRRLSMMKALGLGAGKIPNEGQSAAPRAPGRDPSTHVSSGGQSAPSFTPSSPPRDALFDQISRAKNATEMDDVSKILQAGMNGDIDIGLQFGS